jgi:hypothetical protein
LFLLDKRSNFRVEAPMRSACWSLLALAILSTTSPGMAGPYEPAIGERHPDFTLPDIWTGKPVSLSDFRGKKVLLIHFASW